MSGESQEFKLLITGDATSAVGAFQQTNEATGGLAKGIAAQGEESKKATGAMEGHSEAATKLGEEVTQ